MSNTRHIVIYSAGCPACDEVVQQVQEMTCPSCVVEVIDVRHESVHAQMTGIGIRSLPAVVVDGKLAACCEGSRVSREALAREGIGVPLN